MALYGEEVPQGNFSLSSYRGGHYQPNGDFSPEPLFSDATLATWEDQNRRVWQAKAWGIGQALFFRDKPLTFGRNPEEVDVLVDKDPDEGGQILEELGVSRRHFELQPPKGRKVQITDLGSTNGVRVYSSKEGRITQKLDQNNPSYDLGVSDFAIFGGGEDRLIGFRVCEDRLGKVFLVKFNARDEDDLLTLAGRVRPRQSAEPETIPTSGEFDKAVSAAYQKLLSDVVGLREATRRGEPSPGVLSAHRLLFSDLFSLTEQLGTRFFDGDWTMAAARIGKLATDEAEKSGQKVEQARALEVALLASRLANGKLVESVKED